MLYAADVSHDPAEQLASNPPHPFQHGHIISGECEGITYTFSYTEFRGDLREPHPWRVVFDGVTQDGSEVTASPEVASYFASMARVDSGGLLGCTSSGPTFMLGHTDRTEFEAMIANRDENLELDTYLVTFKLEDGILVPWTPLPRSDG